MQDRHRYNAGQLFAAFVAVVAGGLTAASIALRFGARTVERTAGGAL